MRGIRVELGEVERALARYPHAQSVAVDVRVHPEAGPALVGYLVPVAGANVDPAEVRAFLLGTVSHHMVPDVVVVLGDLPLTRNGKVDRRALPDPAREASARVGHEPLTPAQKAVAELWTSVLPVRTVGRTAGSST
ncbi:AMP-binding enzyme [Micromonospora sp. LOL_015]|uniref:AMP-binding enzyme n=1 Tax=Micromonospora sp. LOL_015 TaxID=3345416 RepID=UPI003A85D01D